MLRLPGQIAEGDVRAEDGTLLRGTVPPSLAPGDAAVAAVRPERIRVSPGVATANRLSGRIEAVAYHGLDRQLHIRVAGAPQPFLVRVGADAADRQPLEPGRQIEFGWLASDQRIFAA